MFKKFFVKEEVEEEVQYETVDPVLEQRRKEKFSAPLIYNDEVEEEKKVETKKPVETTKQKPVEQTYKMSQIISPMTGIKKTFEPEVVKTTPKKKKPVVVKENSLVPIISPFYGPEEVEEQELVFKSEKKSKKQNKSKEVVNKEVKEEPEVLTVESNLRNIAKIVQEEQDELKIIEERTGEFKLDFSKRDENSFIDEIDDSMSLDELMSLYEKKFKD